MKSKLLLLNVFFLVFTQCTIKNEQHIDRAFYYWKNDSDYDDTYNFNELEKLKVNKIYIKLFEVDHSEIRGNYPYSKVDISNRDRFIYDSIQLVPTVFIKNGIFQYNDENSLDKLADNICHLVAKRMKEGSEYSEDRETALSYSEIQIDCDWTISTKDKYFYLLRKIKEKSQLKISCTLRLYPYKFQKEMGVPPVDRVMLMCYNLLNPFKNKDKNSIFDLEEFKKYIGNKTSYPVNMDIALPVFSWGHLYQNNQFTRFLNITQKDISNFTKLSKPMWYEVTQDKWLDEDTYLRVGDQIKYEDVPATTLKEAISILKQNTDLDKNITISLFDLDDSTFKIYSNEELVGFYTAFAE